jgi:hypothetical protein
MTEYAQAVRRGCGTRKQGGVYAECGSSRKGKPVEAFLLCPPVVVDDKALGLSPDGNVWDWVGSTHYPNVTDFIEEVRRFGLSRRSPKTIDFSRLGPNSRMILLHSKAHIDDTTLYHTERVGGKAIGMEWDWCPLGIHDHSDVGMCAGLWWEDVEKVRGHNRDLGRVCTVEMPSFEYKAVEGRPVKHSLAVFASFPITRLAVIRADDGSHNETAEVVSKSSIKCEVLDD